jgi:hypothetical protein
MTVPERCKARTFIKKTHQAGQDHKKKPAVERTMSPAEARNMSILGLKPPSVLSSSGGTVLRIVRGSTAADMLHRSYTVNSGSIRYDGLQIKFCDVYSVLEVPNGTYLQPGKNL